MNAPAPQSPQSPSSGEAEPYGEDLTSGAKFVRYALLGLVLGLILTGIGAAFVSW